MAITEVITVDATAPKAFFEGLADALESFGKLTDDEREHLPFRARHGLDILQRTCEEHLNGTAPAAAAGKGAAEPSYQGRIIIEWPNAHPSGQPMQAWRVSIFDADTGERISTASKARITADVNGWVAAELTQLLGMDDQPLLDEPADPVTGKVPPCVLNIGDDGRPKERTFRYLVTEMRVRQDFKPIPPEPAAGGVTLEPREHRYPSGGILSVGSEPVTP